MDPCASCTDPPSSPRDLSVTSWSSDYVELSWLSPQTDGGSPLVQYIIEKCDVSRQPAAAAAGGSAAPSMWMVCGTVPASELTVRVGKLLQGNSYLFRISAENRVGPGPPAQLSEPVVAKLPYGMYKV